MLSLYLCFISFSYLDLYLIGDDTLISWGPLMQTRRLFVLKQIRNKGEVGYHITSVGPPAEMFY